MGECFQAYDHLFLSGRRNLLMLAANTSNTNTTIFHWRHIGSGETLGDQWDVYFLLSAYCLSEIFPEECQLQFSVANMVAVISCSLIKVICMLALLLTHHTPTLVTLGDAIASFFDETHCARVGRATMSKEKGIADEWAKARNRGQSGFQPVSPHARLFYRQIWGYRWFRAASVRRWLFCNSL